MTSDTGTDTDTGARRDEPGTRAFRNALVWLHAVSSIGWLGQVIAMLTLLVVGSARPGQLAAAEAMAHVVDRNALIPLANASATSGFMLSALTRWGYARSWWVLIKAVLTVAQLALGIWVLSAEADQLPLVAAMVAVLAFQAWLSVGKPWGRTPWSRRRTARAPLGSRRMYAWSFAVPWLDAAAGVLAGHPMPLLSLATVVGYAAARGRRVVRRGGPGATTRTA